MEFEYKDFKATSSASLETITRVANAWLKETAVTVINIETLKSDCYTESGIRIWYRES